MEIFKKRPLAAASILLILSSITAFLLNRNGASCLWALFPFLFFFLFALLHLARRQKSRGLLLLFLAFSMLLGLLSQLLYDTRAHRPWRQADGGALHSIVATVDRTEAVSEKEVCYSISVEELDGRAVSEEVVAGIFSKFCVGK